MMLHKLLTRQQSTLIIIAYIGVFLDVSTTLIGFKIGLTELNPLVNLLSPLMSVEGVLLLTAFLTLGLYYLMGVLHKKSITTKAKLIIYYLTLFGVLFRFVAVGFNIGSITWVLA